MSFPVYKTLKLCNAKISLWKLCTAKPSSACIFASSDQALCCPLTESLESIDYQFMSRDTAFPTRLHVPAVNTQLNLRILAVRTESSLSASNRFGFLG